MRHETMFRDEAVLLASAGRGGDGCHSFHREKYKPRGGPDGGDGGAGGDVVLVAMENQNSLFALSRTRHARAESGSPGRGSHKTGASGADAIVEVPVGTQVSDLDRGNLLADLDHPGARVVICRGGKGGRGNARFANSMNQAPTYFERGKDGEARRLKLELKLVADVGLVGLPNAGKSTLLARVTQARPRVADYPFTTLDPHLGILEVGGEPGSLVLADIPGLIEGAAEGKGLGHQFLRHVERTRVLLHLVDCSAAAEDPAADHAVVRAELARYSTTLGERRCVLAATKVEDAEAEARAAALFEAAGEDGIAISSATGRGLDALLRRLLGEVETARERPN